MKARIGVRAATPDDVPALVAMCDALNAHSGLPTGRLRPSEFRKALFGARAFMFADIAFARARGAATASPVGYALSHDSFTTDFGERGVYIVDLFVESGWRRQGVASRLMAAVAARAKRRGASHIWWASMPRNYPARRFYASLGATDEAIHSHAVLSLIHI
jgi:GNAT superfamily N-acetyltransferase